MGCKGCQKFAILRFTQDQPHKVMAINLTLEEAREWVARDDTKGEGWFDGYTAQQYFHVQEFNDA